MNNTYQNKVIELGFSSDIKYADPFNDIELSVQFSGPDNEKMLVPAYWAGKEEWRVRYSSSKIGVHHFTTVCSDKSNKSLHGRKGKVEVSVYTGENKLMKHGAVGISENGRYFEHKDKTPFFWLGDTWWMALTKRLDWPDDYMTLVKDRVRKGFSVIQIVAGLYPDMPWFDDRGRNEAGFPWDKDFDRIDPLYFDNADKKIDMLVENGLLPCIVGCWGYFLNWMGIEKMMKHWRYLAARYGAYPVIWCLAGEGSMPYHLSDQKDEDTESLRNGWTEIGRYLRTIDPYKRPVTIHPVNNSRDTITDDTILDFDMLQTGHSDRESLSNTVETIKKSYNSIPVMPVIDGEVCYEGIGEACRQEVQRLMFWASILNGAAGHTYGANGVWQLNSRKQPYGKSPHGMSWGNTPWRDAYRLPGSSHLGMSKKLLEKYKWWETEPHPEWIEPRFSGSDYFLPYSAGIKGELRIFYFPKVHWQRIVIKDIEPGIIYDAFLIDPTNCKRIDLGRVNGDMNGDWIFQEKVSITKKSEFPIYQDWLLFMTRTTDKKRGSENG